VRSPSGTASRVPLDAIRRLSYHSRRHGDFDLNPLSLTEFACLVAAAAEARDEATIARAVADALPALLANPSLLRRAEREGSPEGYRQHVLHADPDGRFSIVALVWRPGQSTPTHDHVAWCVVGVYEGEERETRFVRRGGGRLAPVDVQCYRRGDVTYLVPAGEHDIHRVENIGADTAVSIHVYGTNIPRVGTSIRQRYDDTEVVDR
jgi:predicted metal-dependent enzyme (double-stranded beta helix superfamily)